MRVTDGADTWWVSVFIVKGLGTGWQNVKRLGSKGERAAILAGCRAGLTVKRFTGIWGRENVRWGYGTWFEGAVGVSTEARGGYGVGGRERVWIGWERRGLEDGWLRKGGTES